MNNKRNFRGAPGWRIFGRRAQVRHAWTLDFDDDPSALGTAVDCGRGHRRTVLLSIQQRDWCFASGLEELAEHLPVWVPQRLISLALYGEEGVATVVQALAARGPWVWAGALSNVHETFAFDEPAIVIDGVRVVGGPEAYFQLAKSEGMPDHADAVAAYTARPSPGHAYVVGRTHSMRPDWEQVKAGVMRRAVAAKFAHDRPLRALLRSTGAHRLVQLKPYDPYWGTGADGRGRNELGVILEEELRAGFTAND